MALPITAVQILWVNLITAVTLGIALAFEPSEPGTMRRPPRPRDEPLLTGELIWHIVLVSTLFLAAVFGMYFYAIDRGYPVALAQTIAMNTLVVLEIFHLFFIRNIHGTSLTWAARAARGSSGPAFAVTAAQFAITYAAAAAGGLRHPGSAAAGRGPDRGGRRGVLRPGRDREADAPGVPQPTSEPAHGRMIPTAIAFSASARRGVVLGQDAREPVRGFVQVPPYACLRPVDPAVAAYPDWSGLGERRLPLCVPTVALESGPIKLNLWGFPWFWISDSC
jgi:hypothetical protein